MTARTVRESSRSTVKAERAANRDATSALGLVSITAPERLLRVEVQSVLIAIEHVPCAPRLYPMTVMRRLAFLVILLAAAVGIAAAQGTPKQGGTKQKSGQKTEGAKQSDQNHETADKVAIPTTDQPCAHLSHTHTVKSSEDAEIQWKVVEFTKWLAIVGALQFLALIVQAIVFGRTLRQVRMQAVLMREHAGHLESLATAARDNAKAAKTSADALIGAERAWILEAINFPNNLPVQPIAGDVIIVYVGFTFTNRGGTPARVLAIKLRFHTVETPNSLSDSPQYDTTSMPELGAYGRMLAFGEPISVGRSLEGRAAFKEGDRQAIAENRLSLYAYGIIEYETLGIKASTQFCYVWCEPWGFSTSADVAGFRKGGPPAYNKAI